MPAFALVPVDTPGGFGRVSINSGQAQKLHGPMIKANIGAHDRRTAISEVFSPEMQANLERVMGLVTCRIGKFNHTAEARIIEDCRQIITNAHVFAEDGLPIPDDLPKCTFATKANPGRKIDLDLRDGNYRFFSLNPDKDRRNDEALVRLRRPVSGVKIPKIGSAPQVGEKVYLVSHNSEGVTRPIDPRQLVAQDCTTWTVRPSTPSAIGFFTNDCSALPGDSGATYYVVRDGETLAVGFEVGGGWATANHRPWDITNPDPKLRSFSAGLIYDERLLGESRALANRANETANTARKTR
jgi:hypothetical protein